jgi:hypothetical protein
MGWRTSVWSPWYRSVGEYDTPLTPAQCQARLEREREPWWTWRGNQPFPARPRPLIIDLSQQGFAFANRQDTYVAGRFVPQLFGTRIRLRRHWPFTYQLLAVWLGGLSAMATIGMVLAVVGYLARARNPPTLATLLAMGAFLLLCLSLTLGFVALARAQLTLAWARHESWLWETLLAHPALTAPSPASEIVPRRG